MYEPMKTDRIILLAWGGFFGALFFLAVTKPSLLPESWCVPGEDHCFREWVGALSGWVAALAAACTIGVLVVQTNAARRAATTANEALELTRTATIQQQRAYIVLNGALPKTLTTKPRVAIQFKNVGMTPAMNVMVELRYGIGDVDQRTPEVTKRETLSVFNVGPQQIIEPEFALDSAMIAHGITSAQRGTPSFGCRVRITYRDAFDGERISSFKCKLADKDGNVTFVTAEGSLENT